MDVIIPPHPTPPPPSGRAGEVRFGVFGLLSGQNGPPQRKGKEHSQADQAGEVRFGGFGLLSGQNGPPGRKGTETHRQLSCDEVTVPVCAQEHGRYHPTPPHPPPPPTPPPHPTHPKTRYGVADEGKMVSQMRENQGGFGVTDEGFWCHRRGAYSFL